MYILARHRDLHSVPQGSLSRLFQLYPSRLSKLPHIFGMVLDLEANSLTAFAEFTAFAGRKNSYKQSFATELKIKIEPCRNEVAF